MKPTNLALISIALSACGVVGCGTGDVSVPSSKPTPRQEAQQVALDALAPMDPAQAQINIVADPFLAPASELASLNVPTLNLVGIEAHNADYAQIVRCAAGTILKSSTGEDVYDVMKQPNSLEKLKWIWINKVWSQSDRCKVVGGNTAKISRERFQDISAKSGDFFYVINPCIVAERSTKKEVCSYRLVITSEIKYENKLSVEFLNTAEKLTVAEAYFAGLYSQLYLDTQIIRLRQDECEHNYAVSQAQQNFWKGVVGLAMGGIGATIGGVMSGGTAALQGFQTGIGLATSLFKKVPPVPQICPVADSVIEHARGISEQVDGALQNVIDLRIKLAQIDETYGKLDAKILKGE